MIFCIVPPPLTTKEVLLTTAALATTRETGIEIGFALAASAEVAKASPGVTAGYVVLNMTKPSVGLVKSEILCSNSL